MKQIIIIGSLQAAG